MIIANRTKRYVIKAVLPLVFAATLGGCAITFPEDSNVSEKASDETAYNKTELKNDGISYLPVREDIALDPDWKYALMSEINTGSAALYRARSDRKDIVIGVNAGHGTAGGESAKVYCHPDRSPKITSGSNPAGSLSCEAPSSPLPAGPEAILLSRRGSPRIPAYSVQILSA